MTNKTGAVDPVIEAMLKRIPPAGSEWPLAERSEWIMAMHGIFDMVYGPVERIVVDVTELMPIQQRAAEVLVKGLSEENVRRAEADSGEKTPSEPDPPKAQLPAVMPRKNLGGAPSKSGRPAGLPQNVQLAREAIEALGGRASAPQIRDWIRKTYWSQLPDHWTAVLWNFVTEKKLRRDGINFIVPGTPPVAPEQPPPPKPIAPPPFPPPTPKPQGIKFDHNGTSTLLPDTRSLVLASKLRAAMGKGHVAEAFLAEQVIGSNTERHRDTIKRVCLAMNDRLAEVGLKIEHYSGFGLLMKEIGA